MISIWGEKNVLSIEWKTTKYSIEQHILYNKPQNNQNDQFLHKCSFPLNTTEKSLTIAANNFILSLDYYRLN